MYMYFFLTAFSSLKRFVKVVAPLVTVVQITQMVYGLFINGFAVWNYFVGDYCHIQDVAVYSAVIMYASYFVLFSKLFLENRRSKASVRQAKVAATAAEQGEVGTPAGARTELVARAEPSASWRRRAVSAGLM